MNGKKYYTCPGAICDSQTVNRRCCQCMQGIIQHQIDTHPEWPEPLVQAEKALIRDYARVEGLLAP